MFTIFLPSFLPVLHKHVIVKITTQFDLPVEMVVHFCTYSVYSCTLFAIYYQSKDQLGKYPPLYPQYISLQGAKLHNVTHIRGLTLEIYLEQPRRHNIVRMHRVLTPVIRGYWFWGYILVTLHSYPRIFIIYWLWHLHDSLNRPCTAKFYA